MFQHWPLPLRMDLDGRIPRGKDCLVWDRETEDQDVIMRWDMQQCGCKHIRVWKVWNIFGKPFDTHTFFALLSPWRRIKIKLPSHLHTCVFTVSVSCNLIQPRVRKYTCVWLNLLLIYAKKISNQTNGKCFRFMLSHPIVFDYSLKWRIYMLN